MLSLLFSASTFLSPRFDSDYGVSGCAVFPVYSPDVRREMDQRCYVFYHHHCSWRRISLASAGRDEVLVASSPQARFSHLFLPAVLSHSHLLVQCVVSALLWCVSRFVTKVPISLLLRWLGRKHLFVPLVLRSVVTWGLFTRVTPSSCAVVTSHPCLSSGGLVVSTSGLLVLQ